MASERPSYCSNCGKAVNGHANFCGACGSQLRDVASEPPRQTVYDIAMIGYRVVQKKRFMSQALGAFTLVAATGEILEQSESYQAWYDPRDDDSASLSWEPPRRYHAAFVQKVVAAGWEQTAVMPKDRWFEMRLRRPR